MTIFEFLKRHDLKLRIPQRNDFGLRVSDSYRAAYEEAPPKIEQQEGNHLFKVRDYPETFERQMMIDFNAWAESVGFGRKLNVPDEGESIKAARVVLRRTKKPESQPSDSRGGGTPNVIKRKRISRDERFSSYGGGGDRE
jgi:hypothetical protein